MEILTEVSKNETQSLVNLVKNEASYLCCFNRYAQEFEQRNDVLKAKLEDVSITIDKARGASHVTYSALQWKCEAEKLIVVANDTKKEKCLKDLCLNCWRHYQKGRGLAKQTLDIDKLLERCNFEILAGPTDLPGIKYHCLQNFMHFESRNAKLQDLRETLKGEEHVTIGLHGLGGTGKTSMAKEVGAELEGSTFGKVIILVVSNPPDFKKLQREIARHLDLELKDGEQELLQDRILKKISEIKERLLIVLDDVWGEFNLTIELGIPPRHMRKTCTILITTRNKDICTKMECQREIHLVALTNKEALSLFLEHTDSASNLESLAPKIVKHCHGIPVVIVAVARSLKGQPPIVWKEALRNLQSGRSILKAHGDGLKMAYEGLKLSYDNLRSEKTKKLFLISSLFPEDFEIPMEFLMGIGVGMGPFGEVDDYSERRRQVLDAIVVELLGSSLLLSAERQCVKMHDLVHEVALLIGEKELMQSLIESTSHVKRGLQCLLWNSTAFPKYVDGRNLEILLIFLVQDGLTDLEVPDKFFTDMKKLKVLVLQCESGYRLLAPSLLPSIQSLQDIRTLKLVNLKLCSIFVLENLPNLENLWLDNCSFIKLPEESFRLGELRCLRIEECEIKMSNPFDLIEASPNLEEFTFLRNEYGYDDASSQKVSFHMLHIYQIYSYRDLSDYFEKYGSLSRCFAPNRSLKRLLSEKTFEELARTAEFLCLTGDGETEQKNLIPDIVVPVDDGGMTDWIILELRNWPDMHCLIDAMNHHSYVNAFSNLAEICLSYMGLRNILFDGNYNLCHLKTMTLKFCPKLTSIFLPSTAQTLSQLEDLIIEVCRALECIIASDNDKKSYSTLLPKLKTLQIDWCGNLEIILPMLPGGDNLERITIKRCQKLKYIFDKFQEANVMLPSLQEIELEEVPSLVGIFREYEKSISSPLQQPACTASRDNLKEIIPSTRKHSFSWAKVCCFKSRRATCEKINGAVSVGRLTDEGIPQGLPASKKWIDAAPAPKIVKQLVLHAHCIRKMRLARVSLYSVSALCTLSIASTISWEELTITKCDGLKHLVTSKEDDYKQQITHCSIFPKLQNLEISRCKDLEFLFMSSISIKIEVLKSLTICDAPKLSYVVGKYQNDELHFDLPALEVICFEDVPELISIGPMKFKLESPSLQKICLEEGQLTSNTTKEVDASTDGVPQSLAAQSLLVQPLRKIRKMDLWKCGNLISLSTPSMAASIISLEHLTIRQCHKLKCITTHDGDTQVDMNNCSIFPTLEELEIEDCEELEIIFASAISTNIDKLKSLTIKKVPKLKYVVGNYQKEQHSSNYDQNDEIHFNLPSLEILVIKYAPMMESICSKKYKLELSSSLNVVIENCGIKSLTDYSIANSTTTEGLLASKAWIDAAPTFLKQLALDPHCIRKMTLAHVSLYSVSALCTLSIASTISWEKLKITKCDGLKHLVTSEEDDCKQQINHGSIFPKLQNLEIRECKDLEFLFLSSISIKIEVLKSLTISDAPKLLYVVGKYQNDELHFDLPALEALCFKDVPEFISFAPMNFELMSPSLQNVSLDERQLNSNITKEVHASTNGTPLFNVAQSLLIQPWKNIRKIEFVRCANLISLITLSIASAIVLEVLEIEECNQLKYIVADEGDDRTHKNYNSIFPKLKMLKVLDCNALEYLLPADAFRCPSHLKSLRITEAPMLKYVFGRNQYEDSSTQDENQNFPILINFCALKYLCINDVPKLVSMYPQCYYLRAPSLRYLILEALPQSALRPFNEFLVWWHIEQHETKVMEICWKTLETLRLCDSKIEKIFDLTYMKTEKKGDELQPLTSNLKMLNLSNLSNLMNICVGPKCIICFRSLQNLKISECKKLKVIFSASTVRSLPMLESLNISKCEELVYIVEEDYETNADEPSFANLRDVGVEHCDKLKYLFSITSSDILPKLWDLNIRECYELEHVLIRRGEMKEMLMKKDVLPQFEYLALEELPNLISICHGIDFQILKDENKCWARVQNCPNFSFYESSQVKEKGKVKLSSHLSIEQSLNMGEETQQSLKKVPIHTSHPNLTLLPTRDNTHASDKIFEVEEEEQEEEQGALITFRRPRSGKKSSSSLPEKKLETFMDGDLFVPPCPKPCEDTKEIVEEGIIVEKPRMTDLSCDSNVIGQSNDKEVDLSVVNRTDSQKASLKDELLDNKVKRETIMKEPKSQEETRHDIQSHEKEEEKKEGGLVNTPGHQSDMNTKISLLKEKPKNPIYGDPNVPCATPILSDQTSKAVPLSPTSSKASPSNDDDIHVSDKSGAAAIGNVIPIPQPTTLCKFKETNVTQDESKANSSEHMSVDSSNHKQIEQKPSYSKGQLEHHDVTKSDINQALNVGGVQEIVEMMKLEASETSLLEEALKTHPQLLFSTNDRSTQMVCISYRVLIDILNILTTKTPFTITKSDKRLLEDKLKDALLLGFDKHWLQSIKTKVFDCDVSEDDHIQETLKVLDNDLNTNEAMLAATHNEEVEAARVVELAQKDLDVALKEHANVMANHTQLLKARQHVLARQNQCWDRIAAKNKPFGF